MQQLEAQLAKVGQLHGHLVGQAAHQRALVGPGGVHQRRLVRGLGLVAQLAFLQVPALAVIAGRHGAEGVLQAGRRSFLVQLGQRALSRRRRQQAGAAAVGRAVGDQTGRAAAVGVGSQPAGGEALDEVLDGFNGGLELKPHADL